MVFLLNWGDQLFENVTPPIVYGTTIGTYSILCKVAARYYVRPRCADRNATARFVVVRIRPAKRRPGVCCQSAHDETAGMHMPQMPIYSTPQRADPVTRGLRDGAAAPVPDCRCPVPGWNPHHTLPACRVRDQPTMLPRRSKAAQPCHTPHHPRPRALLPPCRIYTARLAFGHVRTGARRVSTRPSPLSPWRSRRFCADAEAIEHAFELIKVVEMHNEFATALLPPRPDDDARAELRPELLLKVAQM